MDSEEDLIRKMSTLLPRSRNQLNQLYEADCEMIQADGRTMLFNIDEFSQEDHLREHHPYSLGRNMAIGTLSDIFAAGGIPQYYAHNLVVLKKWSQDYILKLVEGVASVLHQCQCSFIGGDLGISDNCWRYTGTVIGQTHNKPIKRSGAQVNDAIYVTGPIGAGNLEALLKIYAQKGIMGKMIGPTQFKLRQKESQLIAQYATSCIDSSDGLFNAVSQLASCSEVGFTLCDLPFMPRARWAARLKKLSPLLLALAEAGEYELVFTINPQDEANLLASKFHRIGTITAQNRKIIYQNKTIDMNNFSIRARCYHNSEQYVEALINWSKERL